MSRIADTIGGQTNGREGSNWKNVAFNLDPATGNSGSSWYIGANVTF